MSEGNHWYMYIKTWKVETYSLDFIKKTWKNKTNSRNSVTGCPFYTRIDNSFINFVDVAGV